MATTFPATQLQPSNNGLHLTESFEGCRLTAYPDTGGVWTIGYGHTGPEVKPGLTITEVQAETFLMIDFHTAVAGVQWFVHIPVTQDEFDALCDFTFNVGVGNLGNSTLLKDLNAGNLEAAASQFQEWDRVKGQVVAGLLRRRLAEAALFTTDTEGANNG